MSVADTPGVRVPPPLIFASGLVVGVVLDRVAPLGPALPAWRFAALALVAAGLALDVWAMRSFRRARTTVLPWGTASALVPAGPYRFTRNPMYLGMALSYVGIAFVLGSWWALVALPLVLVIMTSYVIRREEGHLDARFGAAYRDYRARVRRWF